MTGWLPPQIDPSHDGLIERKYTPTSSDDDLGHFDLVIKVRLAENCCALTVVCLTVSVFFPIRPSLKTMVSRRRVFRPHSFSLPFESVAIAQTRVHTNRIRACTGLPPR